MQKFESNVPETEFESAWKQNEFIQIQKTESLQRIGQMHESEAMGSGQDKTDNVFLDDVSEKVSLIVHCFAVS